MSALIKYDQARQALAACRNVDDIKDIRDKSEAMRLYAKQANDTELEQWAAEIKLRAQRAIGELSAALEKQTNQSALPSGGKSKSETLADAGISTSAANRYEKLAAIADAAIEAFIAKSKLEGKPVSVKSVMATLATKEPVRPPAPPAPDAKQEHRDDAQGSGVVSATLPAADAADDLSDDGPDPFELLREEQARAEQLQDQVDTLAARVKLLSQGDLAAAADEWKLKFEQLSGRNRQLQEAARDAQLAEKRGLEMLAKIRKALDVESNAEILPALAARRSA